MKNFLLIGIVSALILSCSKSDNTDITCNYLLNVDVNYPINLNLNSQLGFISNPVYFRDVGNKGIIVMNTGTGYVAYDASDPNHTPNACSTITIEGVEGICGCNDQNKYSLFTGQPLGNPELRCGLKSYRWEQSGSDLIIYN